MEIKRSGIGSKNLKAILERAGKKQVRIGFFESSKYPDGTSVAYVATIQEFGHGPIPPRSFFRPTIAEQRSAWGQTLLKGYRAVINEKITVEAMLEQFGALAAGQVKIAISKVQAPPLSPTTLLLRKRKKDPNFKLGGKEVGNAARDAQMVGPRPKGDKSADISGVSTKPLVDTGYMIGQVQHAVEDK